MYEADTIAAIATPAGPGSIAVVRASGPTAEDLARGVFQRRRPGTWQTHRLYGGRILASDGTPLDDGLAVLMRAPRSYTGEDVLELQCHGSPVLVQRVLHSLLSRGARPARPGEFTQRAFLNGKLDLAQAEAVADLIRARTGDAAGVAADQLFGRLSAHLDGLRSELIRAKGHLEACIDFSEEDLGLNEAGLAADLDRVRTDVGALLRTYARGRLLRNGLHVAITGRPNAGKSSLLNALLGSDRAIVTDQPGTTRDVIEESADFDGIPVVLADTAGLRDSDDEVERIGVERARQVAAAADVVLVVLDTARPLAGQPALLEADGSVAVLNKIDLPMAWRPEEIADIEAHYPAVRVSATVPLGLDALRHAVTQRAGGVLRDQLPTLTSARQHDALAKVEVSLARALGALRTGLPPDLIAVDLQAALDHIGAVTGLVTSEEVLDAVFREFCIGK
jgi:tRNA modification GTPase